VPDYSTDHDPRVVSLLTGHYREHPGYGTLRRQGSRSWLLILTTEGEGRFRFPGGEARTQETEVALLKPHTMHEYAVAPGAQVWDLWWAHFQPRPHWSAFLDWPVVGKGLSIVRLGVEAPSVLEAMARAHTHALAGGVADEYLAMAALEEALVRAWRVAAPAGPPLDPRVRRAIELMRADLRRTWSVPELAEAVGLSASRFGHLFQGEVGTSPRLFAERLRMDRARQLLEISDLTIRAIAAEVGYESEFYFSNRFHRFLGLSPSRWRRRELNSPPKSSHK